MQTRTKRDRGATKNANQGSTRGVRILRDRVGRPNPYGVQWSEQGWDEATKRLFVAGGAGGGTIHVYKRSEGDNYTLENTISTLAGGSTCTLVPEKRLLLVVVPQIGPDPGAMFHYEIRN